MRSSTNSSYNHNHDSIPRSGTDTPVTPPLSPGGEEEEMRPSPMNRVWKQLRMDIVDGIMAISAPKRPRRPVERLMCSGYRNDGVGSSSSSSGERTTKRMKRTKKWDDRFCPDEEAADGDIEPDDDRNAEYDAAQMRVMNARRATPMIEATIKTDWRQDPNGGNMVDSNGNRVRDMTEALLMLQSDFTSLYKNYERAGALQGIGEKEEEGNKKKGCSSRNSNNNINTTTTTDTMEVDGEEEEEITAAVAHRGSGPARHHHLLLPRQTATTTTTTRTPTPIPRNLHYNYNIPAPHPRIPRCLLPPSALIRDTTNRASYAASITRQTHAQSTHSCPKTWGP
jgi:hypothetical protein